MFDIILIIYFATIAFAWVSFLEVDSTAKQCRKDYHLKVAQEKSRKERIVSLLILIGYSLIPFYNVYISGVCMLYNFNTYVQQGVTIQQIREGKWIPIE